MRASNAPRFEHMVQSFVCVRKRWGAMMCCRHDRRVPLINSFNNDILINFKFVHTNKMTQIFWIITSVNYEDYLLLCLLHVCVCVWEKIETRR